MGILEISNLGERVEKFRRSICCLGCFVTLLANLVFLMGCGTVANGGKQSIFIQTIVDNKIVQGIDCNLKNRSGAWHVTSSDSVVLDKSWGDLIIICQNKEKTLEGKELVSSRANCSLFASAILLGGVGFATDAASASGADYPHSIIIFMKKVPFGGEQR